MRSPRRPSDHPDRHLECQETVEPRVLTMIAEGRAAGWTLAETTAALIDVADHQMLADAASRQIDEDIAAALRRLGR